MIITEYPFIALYYHVTCTLYFLLISFPFSAVEIPSKILRYRRQNTKVVHTNTKQSVRMICVSRRIQPIFTRTPSVIIFAHKFRLFASLWMNLYKSGGCRTWVKCICSYIVLIHTYIIITHISQVYPTHLSLQLNTSELQSSMLNSFGGRWLEIFQRSFKWNHVWFFDLTHSSYRPLASSLFFLSWKNMWCGWVPFT